MFGFNDLTRSGTAPLSQSNVTNTSADNEMESTNIRPNTRTNNDNITEWNHNLKMNRIEKSLNASRTEKLTHEEADRNSGRINSSQRANRRYSSNTQSFSAYTASMSSNNQLRRPSKANPNKEISSLRSSLNSIENMLGNDISRLNISEKSTGDIVLDLSI